MQVKKEDLRQQILEAAKQEFLDKGYENSSMRVIAKKANTTMGNIYHYFDNKEALLTTLLDPVIENLNHLAEEHFVQDDPNYSIDDVEEAFDLINTQIELTEFRYLMDECLLILFDLKTTHYVALREAFMEKARDHMKFHMKMENDESGYLDIVTNMFVDCIRHVLKEKKNPEETRQEFMKVFRMLCTGLVTIKK